MAVDLTPLEQAAARVGLPGLEARVVPHDRRRGRWFRWGDGALLVSERVVDRCPPDDACALLVDEVLRHSAMRGAWAWSALRAGGIVLALVALAFGWGALNVEALEVENSAPWWLLVLGPCITLGPVAFVLLVGGLWLVRRSRAAEQADDETVALLGDATPLVRGLNEMDFEEIHVAGRVLPARPDLHRRAERLVQKHRLCEAQPPA